MCKINKIPSEIRKFFIEKRRSTIMDEFTKLLENQKIDSRSLGGGVKRDSCKLTNLQVFQILVLMPFFAIPDFSHYAESVLNRMFGGKKDMLFNHWKREALVHKIILLQIEAGASLCKRIDKSSEV